MRHIDDFIDQLENGESPFNIWVYSCKGQYSQFGTQGKKIRTPGLQKALRKHLQIVVEVVNDAEQEAYLLLPEVHAAVPVSFTNGQVQQLTRPNH